MPATDEELKEARLELTRLRGEQIRAEVDKIHADTRAVEAVARTAEDAAFVSGIERERVERKRREELANDKYHHVYWFSEPVTSGGVDRCIAVLDLWHRLEPACPIEIIFNSPGGGVIPGMALFDYITNIRKQGHKVTTVALGYAASMAGILLQAGDRRIMGSEAYLLIHEVNALAMGSMGAIEDEVEFLKKIQSRILDIFAGRSKLSKATIRRKWRRKDWWLSSAEAKKLGFVDAIR